MRKYRLVTRSDFDGLVCAMLLKDLGLINEITFAHPRISGSHDRTPWLVNTTSKRPESVWGRS